MKDVENQIITLTKLFAFKVLTYTINTEELLKIIICISTATKSSSIEKFAEYYDEISLDKKIGLARVILENDYPEILARYPKVFTQINELKRWRNLLAHINRYFVTDHTNNRSHFVIEGRKTSQQEELTEDKMHKIMLEAEKCYNVIAQIMIDVANKKGVQEFYGIKNQL